MRKLFPTAALVLTTTLAALPVVAGTPPNFIVILTDDQGWGTTSVMIDPLVPESKSDFFKTPNVERLAAAGMRFTQGYASHCNCSPSRAALQTGRSPAALHLTDIIERNAGPTYVGNKLIPPQHISAFPAEEKTIPQLLKAHNPAYRTAHFGKWHMRGGGPARYGYDESDGPTANREGSVQANLPDDPKKTFSMTRKAVTFLQQQAEAKRPFYLQVSYYATHEANQARPATLDEFRNASKGKRHDNVPYGAMLSDLDAGIGQLLDAVKAAGISDNTYIIYTADNGSIATSDPASLNGPLRGHKATIWEGGVRVPFMIAGPGVRPNSISRTPVVGYDILPTICDLAGIAPWPKAVEGGSMKAVILGDGSAPVRRAGEFLVFHWPHYQHAKHSTPDTTILADGWKLHYWWETKRVQLFQLDKDLGESQDIAQEQPERATKLKATLEAYLKTIDAQLPEINPNYDPKDDPALNRARAGRNTGANAGAED